MVRTSQTSRGECGAGPARARAGCPAPVVREESPGILARDVHPDLDAAAYGLLTRIGESSGLRITDLAEHLGVGKPTVSRQVALLEQLGLVKRSASDLDARSRRLSLTERGKTLVARAREARRQYLRGQLSDWSTEDVKALAGLLERFNDTP